MTYGYLRGNTSYTIEDKFTKEAILHLTETESSPISVSILDTSGHAEYTGLRQKYIKDSEGFIIVYDITSRASFLEAIELHANVRRVKGPVPCILLANKVDLAQRDPSVRQVSSEEGYSAAQLMGENILFAEISAIVRELVEDVFVQLLRLMQSYSEKHPSPIEEPICYFEEDFPIPSDKNKAVEFETIVTQTVEVPAKTRFGKKLTEKLSKFSVRSSPEARSSEWPGFTYFGSLFGRKKSNNDGAEEGRSNIRMINNLNGFDSYTRNIPYSTPSLLTQSQNNTTSSLSNTLYSSNTSNTLISSSLPKPSKSHSDAENKDEKKEKSSSQCSSSLIKKTVAAFKSKIQFNSTEVQHDSIFLSKLHALDCDLTSPALTAYQEQLPAQGPSLKPVSNSKHAVKIMPTLLENN